MLTEERIAQLESREQRIRQQWTRPRKCSDCKTVKEASAYSVKSRLCKVCAKIRQKARYIRAIETKQEEIQLSRREIHLRNAYGLTSEQYEERVSAQKGLCAICGGSPTGNGKSGNKLNVDHNHVTGEVRDLLCWRCNKLLGDASDNPTILRQAAEYLERHQARLSAKEPPRKEVI